MLVYRAPQARECGCSEDQIRMPAAQRGMGFTPSDLTSTDPAATLIGGIPNLVIYALLAVAAVLIYTHFLSPSAQARRTSLTAAKKRYKAQVARIEAK